MFYAYNDSTIWSLDQLAERFYMSKWSDAEHDEWYKKLMNAKNTDVLVSVDRDLRKITIYSACTDWKQDCLWDAVSDFDTGSLVGLCFERDSSSPDTYTIEVNGAWDINKVFALVVERIKLESCSIHVEVQDTSLP